MLIKLLTWCLLNYGLMNIIVFGTIFQSFRTFFKNVNTQIFFLKPITNFIYEMITCPMCFSTWSGFLFGLIIWSPTHHIFDLSVGISWFFDGILSSGAVWALNSIIEFFEENRIKKD